jgi:valyl-tRNA synthetase
VEWSANGTQPAATVPVPGGSIAILTADAVDTEAEAKRIAQQRERLEKEIARAEGKLANRGFVDKAPAHVVEAEREKLARLRAELEAVG